MIQAYMTSIHCDEETDEVGADEPYVLVTAVDLASTVNVAGFPVPLPAFEVVRYGPFNDMDVDETHHAPGIAQSFWGVTGAAVDLVDPDRAIFVVSLMENDNGDPEALRGIVKGIVGGSVLGSLSLNRGEKVAALLRDVNSAMGTPTGGPNFDEKVGGPQELRFSPDELQRVEGGEIISKTLGFAGDGGRYQVSFQAENPVANVNGFRVFGAIRQKWIATGERGGFLGLPVSNETPAFDGVGRFQHFQGGIVSWHPVTGPNIVFGLIGERWLQIGREQFGYPITDELPTPDGVGRFNHFRALQIAGHPEASIYWHPNTGAHEIFGAIRLTWAEMGFERSHLGYPITPEHDFEGGRLQRFQGGALFWTAAGGVVIR